jgi:hypothetical protein
MGRLSKDLLEHIRKNPPTYWLGSRGITLFEHIDAIELELKVAKEDEERAVAAADRLTENVAQLNTEKTRLDKYLRQAQEEHLKAEQDKETMFKEISTMQDEVLKLREAARQNWYPECKKLKREVTECRAEIERLRALVDEKTKDEQRMFEECETLRAAWLELEKQVPKKVVLPKEVADAIERGRNFLSWEDGAILVKSIRGDWESNSMEVLNTFASFDTQALTLAVALINGYTVEQTKEGRLREGIEKTYSEWVNSAILDPKADQLPFFFDRMTDFVTKFNAEN